MLIRSKVPLIISMTTSISDMRALYTCIYYLRIKSLKKVHTFLLILSSINTLRVFSFLYFLNTKCWTPLTEEENNSVWGIHHLKSRLQLERQPSHFLRISKIELLKKLGKSRFHPNDFIQHNSGFYRFSSCSYCVFRRLRFFISNGTFFVSKN